MSSMPYTCRGCRDHLESTFLLSEVFCLAFNKLWRFLAIHSGGRRFNGNARVRENVDEEEVVVQHPKLQVEGCDEEVREFR